MHTSNRNTTPYDTDVAFYAQTADGCRVTPESRGALRDPVPGKLYRITFCCRERLVGHTATFVGMNDAGECVLTLADGTRAVGAYDLAEINPTAVQLTADEFDPFRSVDVRCSLCLQTHDAQHIWTWLAKTTLCEGCLTDLHTGMVALRKQGQQ
jgi:hypothetical protein